MPNGDDHDEIVKHGVTLINIQQDVKDLTTAMADHRGAMNAKVDGLRTDLNDVKEQVRDIRREDQMVHQARMEMFTRVETLWGERPKEEQRVEFVQRHMMMWEDFKLRNAEDVRTRDIAREKQHDAMWSAYNISRVLLGFFLIEQPIILGALGLLLTR